MAYKWSAPLSKESAYNNYYSFKARLASLFGLSSLPLLPEDHRWPILAVTLIVFAITLMAEDVQGRKKVALACVGGFIASILVAFFFQNVLLRLLAVIFCSIVIILIFLIPRENDEDQRPHP